eukprot:SAG31_NODE_778_length_12161_cov_101.601807_3_plen_86_part_00
MKYIDIDTNNLQCAILPYYEFMHLMTSNDPRCYILNLGIACGRVAKPVLGCLSKPDDNSLRRRVFAVGLPTILPPDAGLFEPYKW